MSMHSDLFVKIFEMVKHWCTDLSEFSASEVFLSEKKIWKIQSKHVLVLIKKIIIIQNKKYSKN